MLAMLKLVLPVLFRVTVCAPLVVLTFWLLKVRLAGETVASASVLVPVPVRLTVCGVVAALLEILRVPLRVSAAVGVKVTLTVQLAPAATELPQLLDSVKSLALVPVTARFVILTEELPVLARVTDCGLLDRSRGWLPKFRLTGDKFNAGVLAVLGTACVAPPPPHEADKMASAIMATRRVAAILRCCSSLLV
jgi:hypothetical protein